MRQHDLDFTTGATAHGLHVKSLPQMVDRILSGFCSCIQKNADVGVQHATECLEEPTVRVDLFLVLFLQAEDHLHRDRAALQRDVLAFQFHGHLSGVLVNVGCYVLAVDLLLGDSVLVDTQTSQNSASPRVDLSTAITDHTDDNLLPSILAPGFAARAGDHVLDVFENTAHCAREQEVIFIIHGDGNEQFCVSRFGEKLLTQREAFFEEIVRIACCSRITHVRELITPRRFSVGHLREQSWCDGAVEHEVSVEQLHFLDRLPSPERGRTGCVRKPRVIVVLVTVFLRTKGVFWVL